MSGAIQEAAATIEQRIQELRSELTQLEKAQSALSSARASEGKPRSSRAARRDAGPPRRRNGRRVDRASEFKKVIAANPAIRPSEAAKQMGISSQQVHGLIKRLRDRGEITRNDKGFKVKK